MQEIPSKYSPKEIEQKWSDFWEKHQLYKADPTSTKPSFSLVMPPPNVTGILHMGHVLGGTLQDVLTRYKRMQGFEVLWLPGLDHAGIATQTVVERDLIKRTGKRRKEISRDDFEKLCWAWTDKHRSGILDQIKSLGCSCDYSRTQFTLDPEINKAVLQLFKKLYDEKLIYQGYYLVHWDPVTQTALADDEVEHEEKKDALYFIKYPISGKSESIIIATTRPETLLGDTAVAVSAEDSRYSSLIGQNIELPFTDRKIPIIADEYVDPEFGTGAVKITPAHDFNDYEVGKRHDLPMINIMTTDGKVNHNGGAFEGFSMQEAREKIVEELKQMGLLIKVEPYTHRVGTSYRSKAVIEPYLSKQWFIHMAPFKEKLRKAVEESNVKLYPENWKSTYFYWIDNLRDWCISRQLWWGHRLPIWYNKKDPDRIICHIEKGLPKEVQENPDEWQQDDDVLDTWFSSALWPFSTMGWPKDADDLKKFYPNSLLITGHDILFFWVARMLMMGEYALEQLPFNEVILTGLIYGKSYWRKSACDGISYVSQEERTSYDLGTTPPKDVHSKWEKISKSKGNAIDPREIIDLYGTCAMRMALTSTSCQLQQIDLDRRKFEEFKNFTNKVWNGARFVLSHLQAIDSKQLQKGLDLNRLQLEDRWILRRLTETTAEVTQSLDTYQFDKAAQKAYEFYWNDFCAYYLEIVKPYLYEKTGTKEDKTQKQSLLFIVLIASIRMLHPMAPFITEELFNILKEIFSEITIHPDCDLFTRDALSSLNAQCCMVSSFPKIINHPTLADHVEQDFAFIKQLVYAIRNIRGEMKLSPGAKTDLFIESDKRQLIEKHSHIIKALVPIDMIHFDDKSTSSFASTALVEKTSLLIPLPLDLLQKEKERLLKEQLKKTQNLEVLSKKLSNPNFVERAPKELVEKQKDLIEQTKDELQTIEKKLASFSKEISS
ncbi:MAG: Valine--tRNA ligase [Chlamydiae bacterium]|nr:Valine--tRNA ligase [Chlamydiota bacterium]